jgi:hypothetical protein
VCFGKVVKTVKETVRGGQAVDIIERWAPARPCPPSVGQMPQVGADQYGDGSKATWVWSLWPG